jgi:serine/threonine-protein kinase
VTTGSGADDETRLESDAHASAPRRAQESLQSLESTGPSINLHSLTGPAYRSATASLASTIAVRDEQAARAKGATKLAFVAAIVTLTALQFPQQHAPWGRAISNVGLLCVLFSALLLLWRQRRSSFDPNEVVLLALVAAPATLAITYDVGVFSPVVLVLFLLVYFFGLSDQGGQSHLVFGACSGGYLLLALLTIVGVVDAGDSMVPLRDVDTTALVALTGVIEVLFAMTYWLARMSRRATMEAMMRLETAQRQIRQREALLDEARAEMRHAKNVARIGRLTGHDVGPYCAGEVLGRGAMGEVYEATQRDDDTRVALKVLHAHMVDSEHYVERFVREARVTSALESEHIVQVYDSGEAFDGSPYLAMEYLQGNDLGWHIRQRGRFSLADAIELIAQLSRGLAVAHEAGVVHRDLKPANVFFDEKNQAWKLLDFGISKVHESGGTLTGGDAIGTPSYMAPEQAGGEEVDARADVFSLGVIAYRVLTGRPAFTGKDAIGTMMAVIKDQPVQPSELAPLDVDVDRALAIALAKERDERFDTARAFAKALFSASRARLPDALRTKADRLLQERPWKRDTSGATQVDRKSSQGAETRVE